MFACKVCSPADPTTDVVKFDAAAIAREQEMAEEAEKAEQAEREEQARLQAEREQQRLEEARRVEAEQLRLRDEELARQLAEEEARQQALEEQAKREREAREREAHEAREREAAKSAEQSRLKQEAEARARQAAVASYLKEKGFKNGAAGAKKSLMSTTYPLHVAAKEGSASMVEMLLREGADPAQKNSSGKIAAQLAEKSNKGGSHAAVLSALSGVAASGRVGGC